MSEGEVKGSDKWEKVRDGGYGKREGKRGWNVNDVE